MFWPATSSSRWLTSRPARPMDCMAMTSSSSMEQRAAGRGPQPALRTVTIALRLAARDLREELLEKIEVMMRQERDAAHAVFDGSSQTAQASACQQDAPTLERRQTSAHGFQRDGSRRHVQRLGCGLAKCLPRLTYLQAGVSQRVL